MSNENSKWYVCHACNSYFYNQWVTIHDDQTDKGYCPRCYSEDISKLGDISKGEELNKPFASIEPSKQLHIRINHKE